MDQEEPKGRMPAYKKVYSDLLMKMKSYNYEPGAFLPSEPELEKIYNVSRTTIRKAINMLVQDGMVQVTQGRGTEVIENVPYRKYTNIKSVSSEYANEQKNVKRMNISQMDIDIVKAKGSTADALNIPVNSSIYRLQRLMSLDDGKPFAFLTNFLPTSLVPGFQNYTNKFSDLYSFLEETYGIKYLSSEEHVSAKAASMLEANVLKVDSGTPLLYCKRIAQCNQGPMECAYSTYVPELYSIVIDMDVRDYAII